MKRTGKVILAAFFLGLGIGNAAHAVPPLTYKNIEMKGYLYSFEVATFKDKRKAFEFILSLPENLRKSAYIYQEGKKYSIRIFLVTSPSVLYKYKSILKASGLPVKLVKTPDNFLYSVQLITTDNKETAQKFLDQLPARVKKEAFLYKTDAGYYTVRVFLARTREEAKRLQAKLTFLPVKTCIVPTSPTKLGLERQQEKLKEANKKLVPLSVPVIKAPIVPGSKAEVVIQPVPPEVKEKVEKIKLKQISNPLIFKNENATINSFKMKRKLKQIIMESNKLIKANKVKVIRTKLSSKVTVLGKEPYITGKKEFSTLFPLIDRTLNIFAQWQYSTSYKNGEKGGFFNENYNLSTPGEITDGIKYLVSVGYSKYHLDTGAWQSTFRPGVNGRLINDIFHLSSSVNLVESKTSSGYDGKNTNYELLFSSMWKPKYPYITAAVSRNSAHSDFTDADTYTRRLSTGYSYRRKFTISYSYSHSRTEDHIRQVFTETTNHNINISAKKSFLNGRIFFSATESIYYSDSRYSLKSVNGFFYQKVTSISGLSGVDTSPAIGTLTPNALLTDNDYSTDAGINLQTVYENIAINANYQPVDLITLYIGGNLTATDISTLHWDLYTSSDGNVWNIVASDIPFSYDNQTQTLNFVLPQRIEDNYIKLVLTATSVVNTGYVTEVEAYKRAVNATTIINDLSTHGDTTKVGLKMRLPLKLGYSFNYERSSRDGKELSSKLSHTLSGLWRYRYIQIGAGAGRTDYFVKDQATRSSQRANLEIKAQPLRTLLLRAGIGYIENFINYDKTSSSFIVSSGLNAKLFTGLNAGLSNDIVKTTNEVSKISSANYMTKLNINAKLFPSLNVAGSIQHNISTTTTDVYSIAATWTPSEVLKINLSQGYIQKEDGKNTSTTNLSLSVVPKGGDIKYSFKVASSNDRRTYTGNAFWQISEYFTANGYLSYTPTGNVLSAGITVNARW
ncbi:SPOR domain-containing protein [Desulfurobacterium sp.]